MNQQLCFNNSDIDVRSLEATHEEADMHLLLHCKHTDLDSVVVWGRDNDDSRHLFHLKFRIKYTYTIKRKSQTRMSDQEARMSDQEASKTQKSITIKNPT